MAEAAAKLTGRPGIALVTRGPAHVTARWRTPRGRMQHRCCSTDPDRRYRRLRLEIDYAACSRDREVGDADRRRRASQLIAHAFDVTTSGRPTGRDRDLRICRSRRPMRRTSVAGIALRNRPTTLTQVGACSPLCSVRCYCSAASAVYPGRGAIHAFARAFRSPVAVSFHRQSLTTERVDLRWRSWRRRSELVARVRATAPSQWGRGSVRPLRRATRCSNPAPLIAISRCHRSAVIRPQLGIVAIERVRRACGAVAPARPGTLGRASACAA